jgi:acetoacetate decarboxylase
MTDVKGFLFPRTGSGRASLIPPPPWYYSGDLLTVEYRTDPARVAELLPAPLGPAPDDPGAVALIWADWQSCSSSREELLDPVRSQYKEAFVVVRCSYRDEVYSRCVAIWVDKDFALARGWFQGYPKKMGSIWMTRPVEVGRAGPRLGPGAVFAATLAANDRRLLEALVTLTGESDEGGFVNALPMLHSRWVPSIAADGTDAHDELITMRSAEVELGPVYRGDAELLVHDVADEELRSLAPVEPIAAYWRRVGATFVGGASLGPHG